MFHLRDHPIVARAAPFVVFLFCLILGSALSDETAALLVVVRGALVAAALLWLWPAYGELRTAEPAHAGSWLLAVLAGVAVFLAWISLDGGGGGLSRMSGFSPLSADGKIDWPVALARLAGFAIVVPVMEELFWRSLVLRLIERHDFTSLAPQRVGWRSFLITTALFAIEHDGWFAGAIAGAIYNGLYMRTGNLWVPILAHVVTNATLGVWILSTGNWQFW